MLNVVYRQIAVTSYDSAASTGSPQLNSNLPNTYFENLNFLFSIL